MEEDECEGIKTFINIGMQCGAMWSDLHAVMTQVFSELIALHHDNSHIRSIDSELFSLSSDETDDTAFKYYISSDDEFDILMELM
jgi:hypothetical protein